MESFSQYYQDRIIDVLLKKKRNGVFLDIGAHDGVTLSNTYFFEKNRNWTGLCIEPIPSVYKKLIYNRTCITENCCILDKEQEIIFRQVEGYAEMLSGMLEFFDEDHIARIDQEIMQFGGSYTDIRMKAKNINNLLIKYNLFMMDYCSIDTEGAELSIIKSIDFKTFDIKLFSIENNSGENELKEYLATLGYICIRGETDNFYLKGNYTLCQKLFILSFFFMAHVQSFKTILYSKLQKIKNIIGIK